MSIQAVVRNIEPECAVQRILIAGGAGFIGSALGAALARNGHVVLSIDNINEYYSPRYKIHRLVRDGFRESDIAECVSNPGVFTARSETHPNHCFSCVDICDAAMLDDVFGFNPDVVVNLAAQPGVRFTQQHPLSAISSNIIGFFNLIEATRSSTARRLLYASSSSVYGNNVTLRYSESDNCNDPLSLYAATKLCDEAIAAAYSNSCGMDTIGVRMFSVYGPWGRPDMAPLIFTDSISCGKVIELYSGGMQTRDFTYIDDVVESLCRLVMLPVTPGHHEVYNIGSGNPVRVCELLSMIERKLGIKAKYVIAPEQHIEARRTYADTSKLLVTTGYEPHTPLEEGIDKMLGWYKTYKR